MSPDRNIKLTLALSAVVVVQLGTSCAGLGASCAAVFFAMESRGSNALLNAEHSENITLRTALDDLFGAYLTLQDAYVDLHDRLDRLQHPSTDAGEAIEAPTDPPQRRPLVKVAPGALPEFAASEASPVAVPPPPQRGAVPAPTDPAPTDKGPFWSIGAQIRDLGLRRSQTRKVWEWAFSNRDWLSSIDGDVILSRGPAKRSARAILPGLVALEPDPELRDEAN
jgi:hypothetical protein